MRILHVITTLDVGGAEMYLLAQVRGQTARGHRVRIAYLKGAGTLAEDFYAAGAEAVRRTPLGPRGLLHLAREARRAELVHSHLLKADAAAALVATVVGRRHRLVSGKHNDEASLRRPLVSRLHGILGNLPRRTIVLSDHVGRYIVEHGRVRPDRIRRVYYGLDPAPFECAAAAEPQARKAARAALGLGEDDFVSICVARFAPQKAHDVLLGAFARLRELLADGGPRAVLLLVGDDPFGDGRRRAQALAAELGLGDAARFLGIRRDVAELYALSDVFVMSSLWEGLGLVFLEAMAAGLPVVSTRVSAIPEVVLDGTTGLLVPARDPEALADALARLARDPGERARLGAAGHGRVREVFGLERMVEETLAVYSELGD